MSSEEDKTKDMDSGQNLELPTMISDGEEDEYDNCQSVNVEDQYPNSTLTWVIKNFADCVKGEDSPDDGPVFIVSDSQKTADVEWGIKLFPKGWGDGIPERYMSLFCEIRNDEEVRSGRKTKYGRFIIEFVNHRDPNYTEMHTVTTTFTSRALDRGWPKYFLIDKMLDPETGFLDKDGSVTVIAHFWRMPNPIEESTNNSYFGNTDYRKETGYVGLQNQGATCYMNSLLQTLYHTSFFARAVFMLPTENDDPLKSVPLALQRVFFGLKYSPTAVSTKELTHSFGWDSHDSFQQHDVQELNRVLTEKLEDKMRGTPAEGMLTQLLSGTIEHKIHCTQVKFDSTREETFYDLSIDVQGCRDLYNSLDKYTEVELLDGDNMYMAEGFGKQPAEKGCKFLKLPPVLHLQLKRWVFDWETERSVKLNDKFDFPMTLDLERYVSDNAPKGQSTVYELYAVLIHSGGAGGGHYYLYQRPTPKNEWFLFNDQRVAKVGATTVMEEAFGGESFNCWINGKNVQGIAKPNTSAYMLVYIRKTDVPNVMFHLHSRDIPYHLHKRFANDAAQADIKRKEEAESNVSKFIRFVSEKDILETNAKRELFNPELIVPEQFPNDTTLSALYDAAAKKFEVDVSRIRIYPFEKRKNQSYRIIPCLQKTENATVGMIGWKKFDVLVLIAPDESAEGEAKKSALWDMIPKPKTTRKNTIHVPQILLFVKRYNPKIEKLEYLGMLAVDTGSKWCDTLINIKKLAGVAEDDELFVYDDRTSNQRIDSGNPQATLKTLHIRHGDVLVVQTPPPKEGEEEKDKKEEEGKEEKEKESAPRFRLYSDFLYYTTNLVTVHFLPLSSDDSATMFQLSLPQTMTYKEILQSMADYLKVDATHIRLTRYNVLYRRADAEPYTKANAPPLNVILGLDSAYSYKSDTIFYEVLDISTDEAEKMVEVKFSFFDEHVKTDGEQLIRMPMEAKVSDVLVKAQEMFASKKESGGSGKYRFCEVVGSRMKVLDPDVSVLEFKSASRQEFRIEEIPQDEDTADKTKGDVVMFAHYEPNYSGQADFFGDPFFMYVPYTMTVHDIRPVIQAKLEMEEGAMTPIKFAHVDGLKPTTLAERDLLVPSEKPLPKGTIIGLMHSRPTHERSKKKKQNRNYVPKERAIVINM